MRKNNFLNIAAALWMGVVAAVGLIACSSEDNFDNNQQPAQSEVHTYSVCIPASFGDAQTRAVVTGTDPISGKPNLVGQFKTTENIMVYNVDLNKKAENNGLMYLHPDADDATTANLKGNLLFDGTVAEGQTLKLFYNASGEEIDYYVYPSLYQSGTLAGLSNYDFAVAEVTISGISGSGPYTLTTSAANFVNLQSMFKFTFTGLPTGVGVQKLAVSSANRKIVTRYYPISGSEFTTVPIEIILDDAARTANGAGVVYASIRFLSGEDDITFTVTGTDGNTYTATKHTTGFSNGKYYTPTIPVTKLAASKALSALTSSEVGWRLGNDGVAYSPTGALPAGVTAEAIIAHVGAVTNYCDKFIAIALDDVDTSFPYWSTALTKVNTYAGNHPITIGGTKYNTNTTGSTYYDRVTNDKTTSSATATSQQTGWRLPSVTDWRYIFQGLCSGPSATSPVGVADHGAYGTGSTLQSAINTACGNTAIVALGYWSSSAHNSIAGYVWIYNFETGKFVYGDGTGGSRVRAVFAY